MQSAKLLSLTIAALAACADSHDSGRLGTAPPPGDGGSGSEPGGGTKPGLIEVQASSTLTAAGAVFAAVPVPGCTTTQVGPCSVQRCDNPGDVQGPLASAGRITISDGHMNLTMDPDDDRSYGYAPPATGGAAFAAGATLSVSAAGDDVPAFAGKAAVLPRPLVAKADYSAIDVSVDLVVAWTGGGPGGRVVFFSETDDPVTIGELNCSFDPAAATGTIPAAALQLLPRCNLDSQACIWSLTSSATTHFVAGDFAIDFTVHGGGAAGEWDAEKP
jgi:hypothetical protein